MYRFIDNFDVKEDHVISIDDIIKLADSVTVTDRIIGRLVKDTWGERVQKISRKSAYRHLDKRQQNAEQSRSFQTMSVEEIRRILDDLCKGHHGWTLPFVNERSAQLMKVVGGKRINGHQLLLEIELVYSINEECQINIMAHGDSIPIKNLGIWADVSISSVRIETLIKILNITDICLGFTPHPHEAESPASTSMTKVVNFVGDGNEAEVRVMSTECQILALADRCHSCSYARKLYEVRRKRKSSSTSVHPKTNNRYLNEAGLKDKLSQRKNSCVATKKRETRLQSKFETQTHVFDDEDHADFGAIFSAIDPDRVPPGMQLLWEEQRKQLSVKSKKSHRWHPTYENIFPFMIKHWQFFKNRIYFFPFPLISE